MPGKPIVGLSALLTLVAAGCGGGDSGKNGTATPAADASPVKNRAEVSACSLLTTEEIAAVTGASVATIKPDTFGTVGTCNYEVPNELLPIVSIVLAPNMPDVATSAEMATWRNQQAGSSSYANIKFIIEPIEGLGVPAIRNEVEGVGLVTVEAAAKGMLLDVTTASLEMSKALMPKALARLP